MFVGFGGPSDTDGISLLGMKGSASAVREGCRHDGMDAPSYEEITRDPHPHGPAGRHQVIQDAMGDVFVVSTLIPIGPQV